MMIKIDRHGEVFGRNIYGEDGWVGHLYHNPRKGEFQPDETGLWLFKTKNFTEKVEITTTSRERVEELIEKLYG